MQNGRNVIWVMTPTVHVKTKTKTKCLEDPTYALFSESRGFKDIEHHILTVNWSTFYWSSRPDQTLRTCVLVVCPLSTMKMRNWQNIIVSPASIKALRGAIPNIHLPHLFSPLKEKIVQGREMFSPLDALLQKRQILGTLVDLSVAV